MSKDQTYGWLILLVSLGVIVGYVWTIFFPPAVGLDMIVLKLTGVAAIGCGFGVLAWIGYTLATTPPPEPIDMSEFETKAEDQAVSEKGTEARQETRAKEDQQPEGKSE